MTRRLAALALSTSLVVSFLAPTSSLAVSSAPIPSSMAAVGDSITQAASTGGSLGADAPQNSWSTGTSSTVNSHLLRLQQLNASIVAHNKSVSGAKVANLKAQMDTVVALSPDPGYLTVLIGGNDLCTDTVDQMTSVADFRTDFAAAMETITTGSPNTSVYVVSIPDVWQLWNLFKNNFWARFIWSSAKICQSLLANPTSTQTADVERRAAVRQRNIDYNLAMEEICESAAFGGRCHFDGHAVFDVQFTTSDVSGDYFHPSIAGQAKLASVSWDAGFTWTSSEPANQAPTASFTYSCEERACTFDATASSDADGTIQSYAWTFGDGASATGATAAHTYGDDGDYTVSLTVTDDDGGTDTSSQSVNVTAPSTSISLSISASKVKGTKTADLAWSGATATNVDIHRDGSLLTTTPNDGAHSDSIGKGRGTHIYQVCEAGTTTCSPEVSASY